MQLQATAASHAIKPAAKIRTSDPKISIAIV
jgi:hypothetical protein